MNRTWKYLLGFAGASGFGSNSTGEQVTENCSLLPNQLTAIITGATSGIGAETARVLAKRGLRIVIPARNLKKAGEVRDEIQKERGEAEIIVMELDLGSFASIRRFCTAFLASGLPLNILVNNAGKYCKKLQFTEDNLEMSFATNYLGHFLLTEMLVGKMIDTAEETGIEGRIVNVSSVVHRWVDREGFIFHDMLAPQRYDGTRAYAQSKVANILHAKELAKKLKVQNARVTINSVHPGIVKTGIIRERNGVMTDAVYLLASKLLKTTAQAASTTCYVALHPNIHGVSGKYFADCNESPCSCLADDKAEAAKLLRLTNNVIHKLSCCRDRSECRFSSMHLCT